MFHKLSKASTTDYPSSGVSIKNLGVELNREDFPVVFTVVFKGALELLCFGMNPLTLISKFGYPRVCFEI